MATKKDDVTKARTCVEGISIVKNQTHSPSFEGKNDLSEAFGKGKELSVNPSSQDVPRKRRVSDLTDDELMQEAMEFWEGCCHNHELCCKSRKKRMRASLIITDPESLSGPPGHLAILEQIEERRMLFKSSEERIALEIEYLLRYMSKGVSTL